MYITLYFTVGKSSSSSSSSINDYVIMCYAIRINLLVKRFIVINSP